MNNQNQRFSKVFDDALAGIRSAFYKERNMKIHAICAVLAVLLGMGVGISKMEWLFIFLCIALVFITELTNSALERVVDLISPNIHPLAKCAKDMAAAAVFIAAIFSVLVAVVIYLPPLLAFISI